MRGFTVYIAKWVWLTSGEYVGVYSGVKEANKCSLSTKVAVLLGNSVLYLVL